MQNAPMYCEMCSAHCNICGSQSDVTRYSGLLGCYALSTCKYLPKFRWIVVFLSSGYSNPRRVLGFDDGVKSSKRVDVPEDLKLRAVHPYQDIHLKSCAREVPELWTRYRSSFSFIFLRTFAKLRKATVSFVMSFCPSARYNSAPTRRIFMKFDIWIFFRKPFEKIKVLLKSDVNNGTVHEDRCTLVIISRWILLRMRNVSDKSCRENQNTQLFLFWKSCRLWDNLEKYGRAGQATDDSRPHAYCMLNT